MVIAAAGGWSGIPKPGILNGDIISSMELQITHGDHNWVLTREGRKYQSRINLIATDIHLQQGSNQS